MGEKCLKQYHTFHECCFTSDITTLSQFSNLGLKYHLPKLQSPVCCPPAPPQLEALMLITCSYWGGDTTQKFQILVVGTVEYYKNNATP